MPQDMEFIKDNPCLGSILVGGIPKGFPHVHNSQLNSMGSLGSYLGEELVKIFLRAASAADPDRAPLVHIGNDYAIGMASTDRYLVYANDPDITCGRMLFYKLSHVSQFHSPGLIPTNPVMTRHFGQRHLACHFTYGFLKPLGRPAGKSKPRELFGLHGPASRTIDPTDNGVSHYL